MTETYAKLAAPFDHVQTDVRGGVEISFITGEQCTSRLNEVLGVGGWSFRILHQDIHQEADEAWVLGELEAMIDGERVVKQQFGSQKIKRSRSSGQPLDLGFDLKGAGTDCLKKCASLVGIALYLYEKTSRPQPQRQPRSEQEQRQAARIAPGKNNLEPTPMRPADKPTPPPLCEDCEKPLQPVEDNNWTVWSLANEGQKRFKRTLCWEHFQQSVTKAAV